MDRRQSQHCWQQYFRRFTSEETKLNLVLKQQVFEYAYQKSLTRTPPTIPKNLQALADKVVNHAYQVKAADIDALKSNFSEIEIYELITAISSGCAKARFDSLYFIEN